MGARIEQLQDRPPTAAARVPDDHRARERSLGQRDETLLADNRCLRRNQTLRDELAVLYGRRRARDERHPQSLDPRCCNVLGLSP